MLCLSSAAYNSSLLSDNSLSLLMFTTANVFNFKHTDFAHEVIDPTQVTTRHYAPGGQIAHIDWQTATLRNEQAAK